MSLALVVDVGRESVEHRLTAAIGTLMSVALALAAAEQATEGGRWWLPLACAVVCAFWCLRRCRRLLRQPPLRLQVTADGSPRLLCTVTGVATDAVVLRAWALERLVFLRIGVPMKVDPATAAAIDGQSASVRGSAGCLLVLARGTFDEHRWHALRRWLVWHRRSRRVADVAS